MNEEYKRIQEWGRQRELERVGREEREGEDGGSKEEDEDWKEDEKNEEAVGGLVGKVAILEERPKVEEGQMEVQ